MKIIKSTGTYTTSQYYQSELLVDTLVVCITGGYTTSQNYTYIHYQSELPVDIGME